MDFTNTPVSGRLLLKHQRAKKVISLLMALAVLLSTALAGISIGVRPALAQPAEENPQLWVRQLGSNSTEEVVDAATDGSGNVYIVGETSGSVDGANNGLTDVFIAKYDANGVKQWARQWGASKIDLPGGLAVDAAGNVFVQISSQSQNQNWNNILVKYDTGGVQQWTRLVGTVRTWPHGPTVDSAGNVYVSGDTGLVRYDSAGNRQVLPDPSGALSGPDRLPGKIMVTDMAAESTTTIYLTGYITKDSWVVNPSGTWYKAQDRVLVKYNTAGHIDWQKEEPTYGHDRGLRGPDVAVDRWGNIYLSAGEFIGDRDWRLTLTKYSSDGAQRWARQLDELWGAWPWVDGLAVDSFGNIYVAGRSSGSIDGVAGFGDYDAFLLKFDSGGKKQWVRPVGTPQMDGARGVAVDQAGNIYLAGDTTGSLNVSYGDRDAFLVKFKGDADTDGDGLLDSWETRGYTVSVQGADVLVDLPAMGANPKKKDIFIEVDWMTGHKPKAEAIDKIVRAFADSPVINPKPNTPPTDPDYSTGINLHVDYGPESVMNPATGEKWRARTQANTVLFVENLGSTNAAGKYIWADFDNVKTHNFSRTRGPAFHYALFAHNLGGLGGTSGISRGIGASDFIVSLGSWTNGEGTVSEQAGTFMHELGHNLGLRHGGATHVGYKPNYLSVMNYSFQTGGLIFNGAEGRYDYSHFKLPDLDEGNLDEAVGLNPGPADRPALANYGTRYWSNGVERASAGVLAIDWNGDGDANDVVSMNINLGPDASDQAITMLSSYNDWPNLIFNGGSIGALGASFTDLPTATEVSDDFTQQMDAQMTHPYKVGAMSNTGDAAVKAGAVTTQAFTVSNLGTEPDTYTISVTSSQGWADLSAVPSALTLAPGESTQVVVPVNVPIGAGTGAVEDLKLSIVSQGNPLIEDVATAHIVTKAANKFVPQLIWTRQFGGYHYDWARDVAVDQAGDIYVVGWTDSNLDDTRPYAPPSASARDAFLVKYKPDGTKAWQRQFGPTSQDVADGVAVDGDGNIYVTGTLPGSLDGNPWAGANDIFLAKYSSDGVKIWTRQFGTFWNDAGHDVAVDGLGNIYIVGSTWGDTTGGSPNMLAEPDVVLAKYGTDGTHQWTRQIGTNRMDEGVGVAADDSGSVYITGFTYGNLDGHLSSGFYDAFLIKYDSNGVKQWSDLLGTDGSDYGYAVATSGSGRIYVAGYGPGRLDGNNLNKTLPFLFRYDSSGRQDWVRQPNLGTYGGSAFGVAADPAGNAYLTGRVDQSAFLVKYSPAGGLDWTTQFGLYNEGWGVAADSFGNVYVGGLQGLPSGGTPYHQPSDQDAFLTRYSIRTAPPSTALSTDPAAPDGPDGWFKTKTAITLTPDETATTFYQWDSTSTTGWTNYSEPFEAPEGEHTLYYYSVDPAGNAEVIQNHAFMVDLTLPITDLTTDPSLPDGGIGWFKTAPTVILTPNEAATTYYQWDSTSAGWNEYTGPFSVPEGEHTLYYYSVDTVGNTEATQSQVLAVNTSVDTTPPTTALATNPAAPSPSGWFETTTAITLTPDETAITYYQWDTSATGAIDHQWAQGEWEAGREPLFDPATGWRIYSGVFDAPLGEHTLYFYSVDTANNTETMRSQVIRVGTPQANQPPILDPIGDRSVDEGQSLIFNVSAIDPEGDLLTYQATGLPQGATFDLATRTFSWTPGYDQSGVYAGSTFEVSDGVISDYEIITIMVNNINRLPVASDLWATTDEDTAVSVNLTATDLDNDPLLYYIITQPTHGVLIGNGSNPFYVPDANFHGFDSFTFKVSDGAADSNTATVTITVNPVNDPPMAVAGPDQTVDSGALVSLLGSGSDVDGDSLTYQWSQIAGPPVVITDTTNTTASFTAPSLSQDTTLTFELKISDGQAFATDTVSVLVRATRTDTTPPEACIRFDPATKDITITATDDSGEPVTVSYTERYLHGHKHHGWKIRTYTLTDTAGNVTNLKIKIKKEGHELKAGVLSIRYGDAYAIRLPKNELKFEWSAKKSGALKELEQHIKVKEAFNVEAKYKAKSDKTCIEIKEEDNHERKLTKPGLVLIRLCISQGRLWVEY